MQYQLFFQLPLADRIQQGIDMLNFGMMVVDNSIRQQNPSFSEVELRIEKLKRLYSTDFSESFLQQVIAHFIANHEKDMQKGEEIQK